VHKSVWRLGFARTSWGSLLHNAPIDPSAGLREKGGEGGRRREREGKDGKAGRGKEGRGKKDDIPSFQIFCLRP